MSVVRRMQVLVAISVIDDATLTRSKQRDKFRATKEAEARLLLLIDAFSRKTGGPRELEGRVKLAKLDFLLRYPRHLSRILSLRGVNPKVVEGVLDIQDQAPIDSRMMRYRYGPWDPAYYALLGSLIGRGLVVAVPMAGRAGFGYRTTDLGMKLAEHLAQDESFAELKARTKVLRQHLDLSGTTLKNLIYELPEVANALWFEELE